MLARTTNARDRAGVEIRSLNPGRTWVRTSYRCDRQHQNSSPPLRLPHHKVEFVRLKLRQQSRSCFIQRSTSSAEVSAHITTHILGSCKGCHRPNRGINHSLKMAERAYKSLSNDTRSDKENTVSPRTSEDGRPVPPRSPSLRMASPQNSHRSSFSEQFRGVPPSPRNSRHFSLTSATAVQDLLNNPPKTDAADPVFAGRDWHTIAVGELVDLEDVSFVEMDTGVEDATNVSIGN